MSRLENFAVDMDLLGFHHKNTTRTAFKGYYHCHRWGEWLLIHAGRGQIMVGERLYELKRGMLFYFQPYQIHRIYVESGPEQPYIRSIIHFNPQAVESSLGPYPGLQAFYRGLWLQKLEVNAFDIQEKMTYMEELLRLYASLHDMADDSLRMENDGLLAAQMLVFLREHYQDVPGAPHAVQRSLRYSEAVIAWLETRYCGTFRLEELAKELHLSKFYVSKIFREETGTSITQYIAARRMKQACILLNSTSLSLEEIGRKIGLSNTSYFCQLFKKTFGLTPNRYRER
ncbi:MAG: AraC family transcriptional regulator [Paenibacillaceae bacterium]|jgi:AraC-like DNA-binding protein|nr:AraC family transcriptional regulator [Paenibacillaceae bacterium]